MFENSKLSFSEMLELRDSHVKVSEEVFILLADKDEVKKRKDLVKKYGYHSNVTFFSDGSVFVDGSKNGDATGWVSTIPPRCQFEISEYIGNNPLVTPETALEPMEGTEFMLSLEDLKESMNAFADQILRAVSVDPQSELSPIDSNKHPIEQCVETGREVLTDSQKLEFFRNLYQK